MRDWALLSLPNFVQDRSLNLSRLLHASSERVPIRLRHSLPCSNPGAQNKAPRILWLEYEGFDPFSGLFRGWVSLRRTYFLMHFLGAKKPHGWYGNSLLSRASRTVDSIALPCLSGSVVFHHIFKKFRGGQSTHTLYIHCKEEAKRHPTLLLIIETFVVLETAG
jgi:hypothetical protein